MPTNSTAQISLLEIRHEDLPGGIMRIQSFQPSGPYAWFNLSFVYRDFDMPGVLGRQTGLNNQSYGILMRCQSVRNSPLSGLLEIYLKDGLKAAVIRSITLESFDGGQTRYGVYQVRESVLVDGLLKLKLQNTSDAIIHTIGSVHPTYQFVEY